VQVVIFARLGGVGKGQIGGRIGAPQRHGGHRAKVMGSGEGVHPRCFGKECATCWKRRRWVAAHGKRV